MRFPRLSFPAHLCLLVLFCIAMAGVWIIPALLAGYSYDVFPTLLARNVASTGVFSLHDALGRVLSTSLIPDIGLLTAADGRLSSFVIGWFSHWIPWENTVAWTAFGAAIIAVALVFLWLAMYKMFDATIAWSTVIITALLPVYWREAVWLGNYNLSLLFLFASFAAFAWLQEKHRSLAFAVSGLLFGLSVAAKDVFFVFLPWYIGAFVWTYRKTWKACVLPGFLFLFCTGVVYLLPYIGDIRDVGYPVNQNIARLWPGAGDIANETYLHLYPDPYTYYFDRERFDAEYLEQLDSASTLDRLQKEKLTLGYGLEDGFFQSLRLGAFLFVQDIPRFFQRHNTGGVFLWLFILPGLFAIFGRDRRMFWWLTGLIITTYIVIRFALKYERDHFMDIGWVIALFAAVGVQQVASIFAKTQKWRSQAGILIFLIAVIAFQLLQANRFEFAERYRRTNVPETFAWISVLQELPEDAVVALHEHPSRINALALLSDRTFAMFRSETVDRLAKEGRLRDAFNEYGVTHAFLYPEEQVVQISRYASSVQIVKTPKASSAKLGKSVNMNFLLHLIR